MSHARRPDAPTDDRTQTAEVAAGDRRAVMQPYLFLVLDGGRPARGSMRWSLAGVTTIAVGRGAPTQAQRRQEGSRWTLDIELDDTQVSRRHARIERDGAGWVVADLGSRNGTSLEGARISERVPLGLGVPLLIGRCVLLLDEGPALPASRPWASTSAALDVPHPNLATVSPSFERETAALVRLLSQATPSVLLRGPTGSGKEMVARAVHDIWAERGRKGPCVAVNCGALPETLAAAELFGARRGSFSGATDNRPGLVRSADGGTLFLDEVADLGPSAQAALLRVLETREVLGLGETRPVQVDVAFVSATHRDLEAMLDAGELRRDLYARLAGYELELPALADRIEDLGLLVARLLAEIGAHEATLTAEAALALARYSWPHNVRELKATLVHAAALANGGSIGLDALPKGVAEPPKEVRPAPGIASAAQDEVGAAGVRSPRDAKIKARLVELLRQHAGNVAAVARDMGKQRRQIHRWVERFGLNVDDFRT